MPKKRPMTVPRRRKPTRRFPAEPLGLADVEALAKAPHPWSNGFRQRGQEAVRCYGAHAYLACCAMCGAAAESVLLALDAAKEGDADRVLRHYVSANGRTKVENLVLGQQPKDIQSAMRGYCTLLKYWRDAAAHGATTGMDDNEAYTSLALLLRLARFASDRWEDLTGRA
jgi:hypothetical protein